MHLWAFRGHLATNDKALRCKCDSCGKTFIYQNNLKTHQKRCKFTARPLLSESEHKCSLCNEVFKDGKKKLDRSSKRSARKPDLQMRLWKNIKVAQFTIISQETCACHRLVSPFHNMLTCLRVPRISFCFTSTISLCV